MSIYFFVFVVKGERSFGGGDDVRTLRDMTRTTFRSQRYALFFDGCFVMLASQKNLAVERGTAAASNREAFSSKDEVEAALK